MTQSFRMQPFGGARGLQAKGASQYGGGPLKRKVPLPTVNCEEIHEGHEGVRPSANARQMRSPQAGTKDRGSGDSGG